MKVKVNINLWDSSTMEQLEELGLTEKFLKIACEKAFEQLVKKINDDSIEYSIDVEVEYNTVK